MPERLKNLETTKNLEPLEPVQHTDIEGFLKNEHENAILAVIAEQKQKTFDEVFVLTFSFYFFKIVF